MGVAAFTSDRDALEFLYGGPAPDPQLNIEPEAQPPMEMQLGPDRLVAEADAAMVNDLDANGEPPLPMDEAEDAPLPPVQQPGAGSMERGATEPFGSDEEALAFLRGEAVERTAGPAVPTDGGFATDEEALSFLRTPEPQPQTPKQAFEFTGAMGTLAVNGQQVPVGGKITFDPARLTQGLQGAYQAGLISEQDYTSAIENAAEVERVAKDREALIKKAQEDEKLKAALEQRAGDNPELMALLYGAGKGGAMTAGAIAGAKTAGAAGAAITAMTPFAPAAPAVGLVTGTAGAVVGGIGAGMAYDAVYEQLGRHFEDYDRVLAAAKLKPEWKLGGELGLAALSLPVSGAQAVQGLRTVAAAEGARGVMRVAGQAAAAGTATGAAAVPVASVMTGEPFTATDVATGAGAGLLMSGFFIGNRRIPDEKINLILNKQATGQGLAKDEAEIFRALELPMRRLTAGMQAAGGREPQVTYNAAQAGVPGFRQATAVRPEMTYYVPPRLPDAAVAARAATRTAGPSAPTVRQAPVNVLPSGEPIVTAPPMTPAMMRPDDFITAMGTERGIDLGFNPEAETELMKEHFAVVREAINNNQPVSADALDLYEMRVPYYVRDEATGLAVFDEPSFKAWGEYVSGQAAEAKAEAKAAGAVELLQAIRDLGGLPGPKSGKSKAVWSGELKMLYENARGGRDLGIKGATALFRNDAPDLDDLVQGLKQRGFRVDTEADLLELLDNRLRSNREIFGYPTVADEPMPMGPRMGRAPRQMDLLGEADVEFNLVGQTDAKSLTPAELAAKAQAEADAAAAEKAQPDLFAGPRRGAATPPAPGSGAWVPPGVVRPADTTTPRPDWVLQNGETSEGRRLIKGIENYKRGQRWGYSAIVQYVNRAVNLQMIRSTSQTTRQHPAVYRPANATEFTRNTRSLLNFHEAGHHLEFLLDAKVPGFWRKFESELIPLTQFPDSLASQPPANYSDANKREYIIGEGVAEWMRRLMVDPPSVQNLQVTAAISEAAERFYPKMAAAIRDASRAVHRFQNKSSDDQWSMGRAQAYETITPSSVMTLAISKGNAAADALATGAPFSRMGRRILRSIVKNWDQADKTEVRAIDKMRQVRKLTNRIQFAHNYKLMVGGETSRAIRGKGLRMLDMEGNFVNLLDFSWQDAIRTVPAKDFQRFMDYGWARESLNRYEWFTARAREARTNGDMEAYEANLNKAQYPLMSDGFTPSQLALIVKRAEQEIPNAQLGFARVQKYFDALLDLKLRGGMKTKDEVELMTQREDYWPLPKVSYGKSSSGVGPRGDVQIGDFTIKGSQEAFQDLNEVAVQRTKQTLDAYANNRLMWIMEDVTAAIAADKTLPVMTRILAGQQIIPLDVPSELAASPAQIREQVMLAVQKHMKQQMGFEPKLRDQDLQILDALEFDGIWRPVRPNDANVISYARNGKRRYLMVTDPGIYNFYANKSAMEGLLKGVDFLLGPMAENYKRNITQSLPFAVMNLQRDLVTQMVLNPDAIGWVPGGSVVQGLWNKIFQKYPQIAQDGLLLSRVEPSSTELMDHLRRSAVMQFLTEGLYVGTSKDPVERTVQSWLQPSNYLLYFPLTGFKSNDVINLVTGGRFLAQLGETSAREGAAAYALRMGAKDEEAAMRYWTSSGQFNEHPLSANLRGLMRPMMFFNPMVQGMRNFGQLLTDPDPAVRGRLMGRLMQVSALASAGAVATYVWMSDDDKERERERPIEDRLGYANVGGFRVPFAYGPEGVIQSLAYNAVMDHLLERPAELGRKEAMLVAARVFDIGSPLAVFGPQVTAFFEAKANFSYFRQKHIVSPWMEALPASEQYYMSTPKFYREVGKWLDYSPAKIEYIMRQAIGRQADETVKLLEAVGGGRPVDLSMAELPYVGRMFARDPMGFGSMSMRRVEEIEAQLRAIDTRLAAKGWTTMLKDPNLDVTTLPTNEMRALYNQLQYLEFIKRGHQTVAGWPSLGGLDRIKQDVKALGTAERFAEEQNMKVLMTRYAQAILTWNADGVEQMEAAMKLLDKLPEATPDQKAMDYLQRVR